MPDWDYIATIQNLHGLYVNFKYNSQYIFLFQYLILATEGIFLMKSPLQKNI